MQAIHNLSVLPANLRSTVMHVARSVIVVAALATAVSAALAAAAHAYDYRLLPADQREHLQNMLVWSGDYEGPIDGQIGPASRAAVKKLQKRLGTTPDGIISDTELQKLGEQADRAFEEADFTVGTDTDAGLYFGMPYAKIEWRDKTESGNLYADEQQRFRVTTFRIEGIDASNVQEFVDAVFEDVPGYASRVKLVRPGHVRVEGADQYEHLFLHALRKDGELRGFFVWFDKTLATTHRRYAVAMANSVEWGEEEPQIAEGAPGSPGTGPDGSQPNGNQRNENVALNPGDLAPNTAPPVPGSARASEPESFGSAFVIREDGQFVTNAHVVRECGRVEIPGLGRVVVKDQDDDLDLAVLSVPGVFGLTPAPLADDDAVLAEDVFAFGFPLPNTLGASLGFSRGSVSSMVGLRSEKRQFRMTAPVQPGNSGGPLLDNEGRVIGIVTSKLNAMRIATETGDIPQGMNFAIKASTLRDYLNRAKLGVTLVARKRQPQQTPAIARLASRFTYQVLCYAK